MIANRTGEHVDARAFDLLPEPGTESGAAVLCLHGLTGTPYEVRPIAEALVARGIRARAPIMAGHEGGVRLLAATSRRAWLERAQAELESLRREHDKVYLVGVSMGGVVSLRLAQTTQVDALVVIGTPLALGAPIPQLLPLIRRLMPYRKKRGSDIQLPAAAARHPSSHDAMPLDAVAQLIALQGEVIPGLAEIRSPILIAHGEKDRTAPPRDARRLHAEVGSTDKELFLLERSGHVATVDHDGPALVRAAVDFLTRR